VWSGSGWETAVFVGATGWESAVFGGSSGWGSVVFVGSSGRKTMVFVGAAGWGSVVSGRSTGWEAGVVGRHAARGCVALVGGLAGIARTVEVSAWRRGAILDSPYPDTSLGGTTMGYRAPWWHLASPSRALVAPPHPHLARIGVGAVQNRLQYHRFISTVCGDAGRPPTNAPKLRAARRADPRRFPPRSSAMRLFAPRRANAHRRSPPQEAPPDIL
jgi:hypothetical protein